MVGKLSPSKTSTITHVKYNESATSIEIHVSSSVLLLCRRSYYFIILLYLILSTVSNVEIFRQDAVFHGLAMLKLVSLALVLDSVTQDDLHSWLTPYSLRPSLLVNAEHHLYL